MTDPWSVQTTQEIIQKRNLVNEVNSDIESSDFKKDSEPLGFEDSFIQDNNSNHIVVEKEGYTIEATAIEHKPLPDSEAYLQSLERKLERLKKSSKLVDALSEKREDCLRSMLQNNINSSSNNDLLLELETSITNSDSAVQNLYRQLQPVQPVTVGETVHIVKYDQLEEQRLETEAKEESRENLSASR